MLFSICLAFSGFSTNTKYDPYQIKAEIASRRDRVSNPSFYSVQILIRHRQRSWHMCFWFTLAFTLGVAAFFLK